MENIKNTYHGQVVFCEEDPSDPFCRKVKISPATGLYSKGEFHFLIRCDQIPCVKCETAILHPNVSLKDGLVNFDQAEGFEQVVGQLVELLYHPNFTEPVSELVPWEDILTEADSVVNSATAGNRIGNYLFPVNPRYRKLHPEAREDTDVHRYLVDGEVILPPDHFGIRKIEPAEDADNGEED